MMANEYKTETFNERSQEKVEVQMIYDWPDMHLFW